MSWKPLLFDFERGKRTYADGWQIEIIEEQTGSMEPRTNFKLIVIQTELERFKFLVRSFLRARIAKVILLYILSYVRFAHLTQEKYYR
jgi:hypothetical protein